MDNLEQLKHQGIANLISFKASARSLSWGLGMIWAPLMVSLDAMFIVVMLSLTLLSPMMVKTHIVATNKSSLQENQSPRNDFRRRETNSWNGYRGLLRNQSNPRGYEPWSLENRVGSKPLRSAIQSLKSSEETHLNNEFTIVSKDLKLKRLQIN